jgi:hypothetical protein
MKKILMSVCAVSMLYCAAMILQLTGVAAATSETELLKADHDFVQALGKGDTGVLGALLDDDFTWTDSAGKTLTREQVLQGLPATGGEAGADAQHRLYGEVGLVTAAQGRLRTARVWVKRSGGWRVLAYHETTLAAQAVPAGPGLKECENPCKTVPYQPRNADEQGVITSWQALETCVTNHDSQGWAQHIADEFTLTNSNNDHVQTKADRMAILDKQKQTGANSAPIPLVSGRMFDFPDAIVMTSLHQRGTNKPTQVTRIWIKRGGAWQMAFSQQTIVQ